MDYTITFTSDLFDLEPSFHKLEATINETNHYSVQILFENNTINLIAEEESVLDDYVLEAVQVLLLNGVDDFNVKRPILNEFCL